MWDNVVCDKDFVCDKVLCEKMCVREKIVWDNVVCDKDCVCHKVLCEKLRVEKMCGTTLSVTKIVCVTKFCVKNCAWKKCVGQRCL